MYKRKQYAFSQIDFQLKFKFDLGLSTGFDLVNSDVFIKEAKIIWNKRFSAKMDCIIFNREETVGAINWQRRILSSLLIFFNDLSDSLIRNKWRQHVFSLVWPLGWLPHYNLEFITRNRQVTAIPKKNGTYPGQDKVKWLRRTNLCVPRGKFLAFYICKFLITVEKRTINFVFNWFGEITI